MRHNQGFTLIEVMIAVFIIGILASIAIPLYSSYVIQGKLSEMGAPMSDARLRQEQFYVDNRNYGTAGGVCGAAMPTGIYFSFGCACAAAVAPSTTCQSYTITATSIANKGLGSSGNYVYTVNQAGAKATTMFAGAAPSTALNYWKTK